jgi:hypothetical protein
MVDKRQAAQQIFLRMLAQPPETIMNMFDRLEIPWARTKVSGEMCMVVKWKDLMEGEQANQSQGSQMKRMLVELQTESPELFSGERNNTDMSQFFDKKGDS